MILAASRPSAFDSPYQFNQTGWNSSSLSAYVDALNEVHRWNSLCSWCQARFSRYLVKITHEHEAIRIFRGTGSGHKNTHKYCNRQLPRNFSSDQNSKQKTQADSTLSKVYSFTQHGWPENTPEELCDYASAKQHLSSYENLLLNHGRLV